ncbi:MAG: hypothetical protein IJX65_00625 [Alistipes sp.]|nr:hypothetical protein [Alistipes sp.]
MELKEIREELQRAVALIEEYEQSQLSIERDTALEIIRRAYEALRFGTVVTAVPTAPVEPVVPDVSVAPVAPVAPTEVAEVAEEAEPVAEVAEATVEAVEEEVPAEEVAPEPIAEVEVAAEPEVEPIAEVQPEVEVEPEPEPEPEPVPVVEPEPEPGPEPIVEPKAQRVVVEPSLFGDDDVWSRPAPSRRRIISLYDEDGAAEPKPRRRRAVKEVAPESVAPAAEVVPAPAPAPTPAPAPEPKVEPAVEVVAEIAEPSTVLADVIEGPKTIADTISSQPSIGESSAVVSLRSAISVGDRFMLIRELFAGDEAKYEQTIDILDGMDNLDDCIIYIAENFYWRSTSEGAKMIMDLLQRKLG